MLGLMETWNLADAVYWMMFSSGCSSRMATDKSALSLSIGCSTADADRSCSCPREAEERKHYAIS